MDVEGLTQGVEEVRNELRSSIGSDVQGNAVLRKDVKQEQLSQSRRIYGIVCGDEDYLLREAVHDDQDGSEAG